MSPFVFVPDGQAVDLLEEGDDAALWAAPQGGHVLLIGVQVANLDSDTIDLRAELLDPQSLESLAENQRTVRVTPIAGGVSESDRRTNSQVAHIPVCPNRAGSQMADRELRLRVQVTELYSDFSEGVAELSIVPRCPPSDPLCDCECEAGYKLDKCGP